MSCKPSPGYEELEDVRGAMIDGLDIRELWRCVGSGRIEEAAGWISEFWEIEPCDVEMVSEPDDILGEFYRIFVKTDCSR